LTLVIFGLFEGFVLHFVLSLQLLDFFFLLGLLIDFSCQSLILGLDLVLQLSNLMRSDTELSSHVSDFILCFNKILGVQISIGSDSLIQVLLLL